MSADDVGWCPEGRNRPAPVAVQVGLLRSSRRINGRQNEIVRSDDQCELLALVGKMVTYSLTDSGRTLGAVPRDRMTV